VAGTVANGGETPTVPVLQAPETNPYPHKFQVTYDDSNFEKEFQHLKSGESVPEKELSIAGRIYSIRASGSKLIFYGRWPGGALPVRQRDISYTEQPQQISALRPIP